MFKRPSELCLSLAFGAMLLAAANAMATEVKVAGKLTIPDRSPLFAVSTDPVIQSTLSEDFRGAHRDSSGASATSPGLPMVTVTVSVKESVLAPGITLGKISLGDPFRVAQLMREAGSEPPPIGDTGDKPTDPYEASIERQQLQGNDPMQAFRDYEAANQVIRNAGQPRFGANGNATDKEIYDSVVVARANAGSNEDLTAVAIIHPGDDVRAAKQLIAEEIANAVLH